MHRPILESSTVFVVLISNLVFSNHNLFMFKHYVRAFKEKQKGKTKMCFIQEKNRCILKPLIQYCTFHRFQISIQNLDIE